MTMTTVHKGDVREKCRYLLILIPRRQLLVLLTVVFHFFFLSGNIFIYTYFFIFLF